MQISNIINHKKKCCHSSVLHGKKTLNECPKNIHIDTNVFKMKSQVTMENLPASIATFLNTYLATKIHHYIQC